MTTQDSDEHLDEELLSQFRRASLDRLLEKSLQIDAQEVQQDTADVPKHIDVKKNASWSENTSSSTPSSGDRLTRPRSLSLTRASIGKVPFISPEPLQQQRNNDVAISTDDSHHHKQSEEASSIETHTRIRSRSISHTYGYSEGSSRRHLLQKANSESLHVHAYRRCHSICWEGGRACRPSTTSTGSPPQQEAQNTTEGLPASIMDRRDSSSSVVTEIHPYSIGEEFFVGLDDDDDADTEDSI